MSGASLTCSAMCRNGATTCTALTTTGKPRLKIRRDRSWGLVVCTGVVHGSSVRVPAGQTSRSSFPADRGVPILGFRAAAVQSSQPSPEQQ